MKKRTLVFSILTQFFLLTACSPANPYLVDTEWVLQSIMGEALVTGTNITLAFTDTDMTGYAGCNGYGGLYTLGVGNAIRVSEIAQTEMACMEAGVMEQESEYLSLLINIGRFTVEGDTLTLFSGEAELVFTRQQAFTGTPEDLINTSWKLVEFNGGSPIAGSVITLAFSEEGISGFAGCRIYTGTYTAEGDSIAFPSMQMHDPNCDDPALQQQENDYTDALSLSSHFNVDGYGSRLTLFMVTGQTAVFERDGA